MQKLISIQAALKAPKGQRNTFGNYNYRSCEDILEALKPLLKQEGLLLTISDSIEFIGNRFYVKATATVADGDKTVSVTAYAREEETKKGMDGSQITGAASSYARKYALNGLFAIDDTKDADATNKHETSVKPPVTANKPNPSNYAKTQQNAPQGQQSVSDKATESQIACIEKLAKTKNADISKYNLASIGKFEASKLIKELQSA